SPGGGRPRPPWPKPSARRGARRSRRFRQVSVDRESANGTRRGAMLNFIGTIVIVATTIASLNIFVSSLAIGRFSRLLVAIAIGAGVGLAVAFAAAGMLAASRGGAPIVGFLFATPLILAAAAAYLFPAARSAMMSVPLLLLIGLNIPRLLGVFFLLLAA